MGRKIGEIINDIKRALISTQLSISDEVLFKEAMICYRSEQYNTNQKKPETNQNTPTEKQLGFIERNMDDFISKGFNVNDITTREEATKIIQAYLDLKKLGKNKSKVQKENKEGLYDEENTYL